MQLSTRQILLAHLALTFVLGALLSSVEQYDTLLTVLMAPVLAAAATLPRRTYLPMAAISLGASLLVILLISGNTIASLSTLFSLAVVMLVTGEILHRQSVARARAERRGAALSALGQRLNQATTTREAAQIIVEAADELIGWDSCVLEIYHAGSGRAESVLLIDTVDGVRRTFPANLQDRSPSPMMRKTLSEGAQLILSAEERRAAGLVSFGDKGRESASLMYVPIRTGSTALGVLSIQSYTPQAYSPDDLATLQVLADYCGGGLERIRAELAVRENEARYRAISELTSDYFFSMSIHPDGRRTTDWVTEGAFAQITGFTVEEFDARGGWPTVVYPDDRPIAERRARRILSGQNDISEMRIVTKGGEVRWLRAYSRPYWDEAQGRVTRMIGAMQDITARKRAEESLLQHQKFESLGVLAGGIAHDFNNLLTIIIGNAELALADLPPEHHVADAIIEVRGAAERAAELTHQMLAYAGRGSFVIRPVSLNQIVEEILLLAGSSLARTLTLRRQLAPELPPIEADHAQISQLILNLVINAAEAIGERAGVVTVSSRLCDVRPAELTGWSHPGDLQPGRYACLEVSDNGPGMDDTTRARIFDPFFSTKFIGRGLGLPVVLGIVRGHGGALDVRSAPDQGTTVTLLLPLQR